MDNLVAPVVGIHDRLAAAREEDGVGIVAVLLDQGGQQGTHVARDSPLAIRDQASVEPNLHRC